MLILRLSCMWEGQYKEKHAALSRFYENFGQLSDPLRLRIVLENDDKVYTVTEVLALCEKLGRPIVLDVHHHRCNNDGENLRNLWPRIVTTWAGEVPKIHISSPKSEKEYRSHADYINPADIIPFLRMAREMNRDLDIMVEAKQKDKAMFRLVEALASEPGIKRIEQAVIEL